MKQNTRKLQNIKYFHQFNFTWADSRRDTDDSVVLFNFCVVMALWTLSIVRKVKY
jgi:hypothetical protein